MAGKKKLQNYAEYSAFNNTFEHTTDVTPGAEFALKGKWNKEYFKNNNPIVLELGCGKGEYTLEEANTYPDKNFIGCDINGARMWRGAKTASEQNIKNVAFLRTRIEFIELYFAPEEIDEIWITFPDPQQKDRKETSRLTAQPFMERYRNIIKKGGLINLKHDSTFFYEYTLEVIKEHNHKLLKSTSNLYDEYLPSLTDEAEIKRLNIKTFYEEKFTKKGFKIKYLQFQLNEKGA